jgi:hypothetical protein
MPVGEFDVAIEFTVGLEKSNPIFVERLAGYIREKSKSRLVDF